MIDAGLAALLLLLAIRGWFRGLVRELLGLAVLVLGFLVAFRVSRPAGSFISGLTGLSPGWGRLVGGFAVFTLISLGAALIARVAHRSIRALPGMTTVNRLAGAGFGVAAASLVIVVVVTIVSIVGVPAGAQDALDESVAVDVITTPDGPVQRTIRTLAGTDDLAALLALRSLIGGTRVVSDDVVVTLPPVATTDLRIDDESAAVLYDMLNRTRVDEQTDPVAWSDALAVLAADVALEMYASGDLQSPSGIENRLDAAGLPFTVATHHSALAVEPAELHHSLSERDSINARRVDEVYRRVGVGVVSGPYGLLTVEVLTG